MKNMKSLKEIDWLQAACRKLKTFFAFLCAFA
jgi:hypothetical protein